MSEKNFGDLFKKRLAISLGRSVDKASSLLSKESRADVFGLKDAVKAKFEADEAVAGNPEKNDAATAILAACYMAFGKDYCEIKKHGQENLLPRLNNYLLAYNEKINVVEKVKATDPEVCEVIFRQAEETKNKLDECFLPTGDSLEDNRRDKLKNFFTLAVGEINSIADELNEVKKPLRPDDDVGQLELNRIKQGRELISAIEMLANVRSCVDANVFSDRKIDDSPAKGTAELANKYSWIISPDYPDQLSDDERRARMLFFSAMSCQTALDKLSYREDGSVGVWKVATYLHKVLGKNDEEISKIMKAMEKTYTNQAEKNGISKLVIEAANYRASSAAYDPNNLHNLVIAMLKKRHPREY
ncbi:MAG: hypothetical protein WCX97_03265 [Candidatus Magasanikbacteria bacterium]